MATLTAPLVRVKTKYQITLPTSLRIKLGVQVGDFLTAEVDRNRLTFTPKSLVDRELALALNDIRHGRVHGPFRSARELTNSLRRSSRINRRRI